MSTTTTTGTLAAGSSKTFTLAPGAAVSLTLSPNPRVTITETPESVSGSGVGGNTSRVHEPQLPGTFAYGPYAMGGVVVVAVASNSGSSVAWTRKDTVVTTSADGTSLVSGDGTYIGNSLAFSQLPNNTLTDTVTTQQQLAVATIPGGMFRADSIIEVEMVGVSTGAGSRTVGFKAGAASGTLATATAFGGTGGVAAHGNVGVRALLWGNGVLGAQRATPNGPIDWAAAHAASLVTLGIDTALDWNIYAYVTFAASGAGDSFMLRPFWGTWRR